MINEVDFKLSVANEQLPTGLSIQLKETLLEYTSHDNIDVINHWLHYFASFCNQNKYLSDVLVWASVVKCNNNAPIGIKNYGLALYKLGKQEQAIDMLLRYQTLLAHSDESTALLLTKMKNGQKID